MTLDCVAITWRAAACQAIAGMLAQVGIKVAFQSAPAAQFFPKLTQATSSFFEFGWTPTTDAWAMLGATVRTLRPGHRHVQRRPLLEPEARRDRRRDPGRAGPREAPRAWCARRSRILAADLPLIPLYRRTLAWAMRADVDVAIWPNDILELRFVRVDPPMTHRASSPSPRPSTSAPAPQTLVGPHLATSGVKRPLRRHRPRAREAAGRTRRSSTC